MTVGEPKPRPVQVSRGIGLSLLLHVAFFSAAILLAGRAHPIAQKLGEPLVVELPKLAEPAPRGNPAERSKKSAPARRASSPPRAAPAAPPAPTGRPPRMAAQAEPPAIKEMPARELGVASAPRLAVPPSPTVEERAAPVPRPAPRIPEPEGPAAPAAGERPPEPRRSEPRPTKPDATPPEERPTASPIESPTTRGDSTAANPEVAATPAPESRVASRPETPAPAPPGVKPGPAQGGVSADPGATGDRLAALRPHVPGGGLRDGRGGIEGEPIPLDTRDPKFSDYFERVRRQIKDKWSYPREAAERNIGGQLVMEFGIAKNGHLRFVEVLRSSGVAVLDDYAVNAVKLASPFPPVPDQMSRGGIPVKAVFNYIIDIGALNNFLR